jgi:hypothetical protein
MFGRGADRKSTSGFNVKARGPAEWMDWSVVASWIDAEGNFTTRERGQTAVMETIVLIHHRRNENRL